LKNKPKKSTILFNSFTVSEPFVSLKRSKIPAKNLFNYIDKERPPSVSPEGGEYSPGSLQASPRGGLEGVSLELRGKMHLLRFFRGWVARLYIFICIFVAERQYHQLTNEDKDMNKRLFFIVSLLAAICSFGRAAEYKGYAVYTSSDSTIVCHDHGKMSEKTGDEIIQLDDFSGARGGLDAFDTDVKAKVKRVRFDPSFTSAKFR
jgi:hypothetical protein